MDAQLHLLPPDPATAPADERPADWRLDDSTRALGRRGVATARSALRAAMRQRYADEPEAGEPARSGHHASAA